MTWLLHHGPRDLAGSDLVVAVVLAEHCNPENGVAYPSVKRIAGMARISERQVTRILADLVTRNVLSVAWEATNKRPTGYLMVGFRGDTCVTPSKQPGVTSEAPRGDIQGQNPDLGVTPMSPKQLRSTSPRNAGVTPEGVTPVDTPPNPPRGESVSELEFARFWSLVVRKEPSRAKALEAWSKATKKTPPDIILAGLRRWLPVWGATDDKSKIPHITTWLNQGRWDVEHPVMPGDRVHSRAEMQAGGRGELVT